MQPELLFKKKVFWRFATRTKNFKRPKNGHDEVSSNKRYCTTKAQNSPRSNRAISLHSGPDSAQSKTLQHPCVVIKVASNGLRSLHHANFKM